MPTISETNYVAFGLASIEYFVELYSHFGEINKATSVAEIDKCLVASGMKTQDRERDDGSTQKLTAISCVRNKFHHPANTLNDADVDMSYHAVASHIEELRKMIKPGL